MARHRRAPKPEGVARLSWQWVARLQVRGSQERQLPKPTGNGTAAGHPLPSLLSMGCTCFYRTSSCSQQALHLLPVAVPSLAVGTLPCLHRALAVRSGSPRGWIWAGATLPGNYIGYLTRAMCLRSIYFIRGPLSAAQEAMDPHLRQWNASLSCLLEGARRLKHGEG